MATESKLIADWSQRWERELTGKWTRKFFSNSGGSRNIPYLDCGGVTYIWVDPTVYK